MITSSRVSKGARLLAVLVLALAPLPSRAQSKTAGFHVGDKIVLAVAGEKQLSDTFTVRAGPLIDLPTVGKLSLTNVTRPQLEDYLTQELGRYIKNPYVRARSLMRIGVFGGVGKPNYYNFPPDALISDAISMSGGPTLEGKVEKIRLEREGKAVLSSDSVRKAMYRGATLDDLGMVSGDELRIPTTADAEKKIRIITYVLGIPVGLYAVYALFHGGR